MLDREEEPACARLKLHEDAQAKQRLIQANLRFVVLLARLTAIEDCRWKSSSTRAPSD